LVQKRSAWLRRACWISMANTPASRPQKAEPMPAITTPLSVTRKVMMAASRSLLSCSAAWRPLATVLISASPAIATTRVLGKASSAPMMVAPNRPTTT
jgi:hypothetical protein